MHSGEKKRDIWANMNLVEKSEHPGEKSVHLDKKSVPNNSKVFLQNMHLEVIRKIGNTPLPCS